MTATSASAETGAAAPREHTGGVIGIALGLLVLAGAIAAVVSQRARTIEPDAALESVFARELPFGLVARAGAALPTGERVVAVDVPSDVAWPRDAAAPAELLFGFYRSPGAVSALFGAEAAIEDFGQLTQWEQTPDFAFRRPLDQGELEWGAWRAAWRRERSHRDDGTWVDTVRVNLSRERSLVVLFATWPPGVDADAAALVPFLEAAELRPAS